MNYNSIEHPKQIMNTNHRFSGIARLKVCLVVLATLSSFHVPAQQKPNSNLWQPWYIFPRTGAQHMDLSGAWELSYMDKQIVSLDELSKRTDPFQTTIPNSIHWSLFKAGKLPHPYYHTNSSLYKWTDEKVWYYKKSFELPQGSAENYSFLCFDGADYFTKVWVNDSLAGVHEGMFGGPNVEIGRLLKWGGSNEIIVELRAGNWGNKASDYESLPRNASGERDYSKRTGYNPRASGRIIKPWVISGGSGCEMFFSLGMWQGVRLETVPKVHLERPSMTSKSVTNAQAQLHLSAEVFHNTHSLQQQLHPWINAQIRHPNEKGEPFVSVTEPLSVLVELSVGKSVVVRKDVPLTIYQGRNWLETDITVPQPKLWNPTGLGDPHLYQVRLSLKRNGQVVDVHEFPYGIRTIERVPTAGPRTGDRFENWQFIVNGKKIFVKGMNFTPQDVLLETSEQQYRWTLGAAKNMGIQLIRVWGGGLLETNTFYKICNELGLMVWQDFPIGNQDTPDYPQDIWEAQVVQNIFRLRNHPSLVVWCGGNEYNPYSYGNAASMGIIERSLQTFDNTRMFVRTTPDEGSIHAYPDMDPVWYSRSYGKEAWISETGMHSLPEAGLFYELVDKKEFTGLGRMWQNDFAAGHPDFIHHFTEYGPGRVPRMLSRASHISDMNDPSIESVSEATQIGAGEFYQVLSEKVQGNYPVTSGLMAWVFKRHWPVIAIQMMDWFGHAGAPYYFMKRTYEPTHVSIDIARLLWAPGETMHLPVQVTNSAGGGSFKASVTVYDDRFQQLYKNEKPLSIKSGTSVNRVEAGSYTIPADYKDRFLFLLAELRDQQGKLISRSFYYPRSLVKMEDKAFYEKYVNEPIAWITLDKGPWLKPTVQKTATALLLEIVSNKPLSDVQSEVTLKLTNTGKTPACMTKLDITGARRAFYASDNYMWMQQGETKEVTMNILWREGKQNAVLTAQAWNAAAVEAALK